MIYVRNLWKRFSPGLLLMAGVLGLLIAAAQPTQAQTLTTLHSFGTDGYYPWGGLVLAEGNLYGTTAYGGADTVGVVFEVNTKKKTENTIYNFCNVQECGPVMGNPFAGVVRDKKGNLYGTTSSCGSCDGWIYEITASGTAETLYTFTGTPDGIDPQSPLIFDAKGNLYGTTAGGGVSPQGGCPNNCGTVFEWSPTGGEKVLHSFNFTSTNPDGMWPVAGLVRDGKGNLYGTTYYGGSTTGACYNTYGGGIVFEVTPKGTEKVLHAFQCGDDSGRPVAGLIRDKAGNLYGTNSGGTECCGYDAGDIFEVTTSGTEKVLYRFCAVQPGCLDGGTPMGGLVMDAAGNLYGTTSGGGNAYGAGTVFELSSQGIYTVLYSFCPAGSPCVDGAHPQGSLVRDAKGNLYGVTAGGGAYGNGTVFKLTP